MKEEKGERRRERGEAHRQRYVLKEKIQHGYFGGCTAPPRLFLEAKRMGRIFNVKLKMDENSFEANSPLGVNFTKKASSEAPWQLFSDIRAAAWGNAIRRRTRAR